MPVENYDVNWWSFGKWIIAGLLFVFLLTQTIVIVGAGERAVILTHALR